jgi:hypothetical protein
MRGRCLDDQSTTVNLSLIGIHEFLRETRGLSPRATHTHATLFTL